LVSHLHVLPDVRSLETDVIVLQQQQQQQLSKLSDGFSSLIHIRNRR
jgi:hypothetical protein